MNTARLVVIGVAVAAGGMAWLMAGSLTPAPVEPVEEVTETAMSRVLVARYDLSIGERLSEAAMEWRDWPEENIASAFISEASSPDALREYDQGIITAPIFAGEPLRAPVIATAGRGFMSAILPSGQRAVSIRVQNEARAAGFILPNDRIDVILTVVDRGAGRDGADAFTTETILQNIRVLAIDQTFEEVDGEKFVTGEIATLALSPGEAELIALADQMGELSLALRSIADIDEDEGSQDNLERMLRGSPNDGGSVRMIRFGVEGG